MTPHNSTPQPEVEKLTVAEVAKRLGINDEAVRKLCRNGDLPGTTQPRNNGP
jgi:hypothetical protein